MVEYCDETITSERTQKNCVHPDAVKSGKQIVEPCRIVIKVTISLLIMGIGIFIEWLWRDKPGLIKQAFPIIIMAVGLILCIQSVWPGTDIEELTNHAQGLTRTNQPTERDDL